MNIQIYSNYDGSITVNGIKYVPASEIDALKAQIMEHDQQFKTINNAISLLNQFLKNDETKNTEAFIEQDELEENNSKVNHRFDEPVKMEELEKSEEITSESLVSKDPKALLNDLGMPSHLIGYQYTIAAIQLSLEDNTYLRNLHKRLYPKIAELFGTNRDIANNIRHAIHMCWKNGNWSNIQALFGDKYNLAAGLPTIRQFITACVEEMSK